MTRNDLEIYAANFGLKLVPVDPVHDAEPRSDFSAGSDDEQSDSARWRAEQRIKARWADGTEDLY